MLAVGVEIVVGVREAVSEGTNVLVIMICGSSTRESDETPDPPEQATNKITNNNTVGSNMAYGSGIFMNMARGSFPHLLITK